MVAVPFPTSSAKGRLAESGGRLINTYSEKLGDGRVKLSRVPGVRAIVEAAAAAAHCRGMIEVNNVVLEALDDRLGTITESGGTFTETQIGSAFAGTETVYFARNNKSPTPDIVAVTDGTAFIVDMSTGATTYPDADVGSAAGADPIETAPRVRMSVSRDGGVTFGNYREAEIGRQGKYRQGVRFNRLGTASAKGAQIQLDYSDPPPFTLFSGDLKVEPRA